MNKPDLYENERRRHLAEVFANPGEYIPNLPAEVQERLRVAEARLRRELDS